jgi:dephospho-CoA kinase
MTVIGLTGGVGMGKSKSAELFSERGVPIVDTDLLARQVVEPGQPALEAIRNEFGEGVISKGGGLDRAAMARIVFSDDASRRRLESIVHPRIRALWVGEVERWKAAGQAFGVVVIPLLFETDAASAFDAVVCVACSSASQRRRLEARGWNAKHIDQRIASQWPIQKKMDLSRHVVWTEPSVQVHREQLDQILRRLNPK